MKRILLSLFITSSVLAAHADEGMWMLTDLQKQNEVAMTELGLLIPANQIYNPDGIALKDAVVHSAVAVPAKSSLPKAWY